MNNNILDSIEWHKDQLEKLLDEDDFTKVELELDEIVEKFRLPGSKDKTKRKSKNGLKAIIGDAFGGKKDDKKSSVSGKKSPLTRERIAYINQRTAETKADVDAYIGSKRA